MTARPAQGRTLFYHRDSEGKAECAPPQYVVWAQKRAGELGVTFDGTPERIQAMMASGASADGDLFLDYGVSGNHLSRPGLDAMIAADQKIEVKVKSWMNPVGVCQMPPGGQLDIVRVANPYGGMMNEVRCR